MNGLKIGLILLAVVAVVVLAVFLFKKFVNPSPILYDSTVCFTGGIGSGKSFSSVKIAIKEYRKAHRAWAVSRFVGKIIRVFNKEKDLSKYFYEEPWLFSNIPIRWGFPWRYKYSYVLTYDHMTFQKRIPEGSIVFVDEISNFVGQNDWKDPVVQNALNEWIRFFRHYINGIFICNSQDIGEIEVDFRRKLNCYYNCFDFQKVFFFFYRVRILRNRVGELTASLTSDFIEDNAKWHYGVLPVWPFKWCQHYDSRCFRHRYDKVRNVAGNRKFAVLTTNSVLRLKGKDKSALDD